MTEKTKAKADPLVAASAILIEGKAFERGEKVTGVSKDELASAVRVRRVVRQSELDADAQPAPDIEAAPDAETPTEGETQ